MSIADRIISELVYGRVQTYPETRYTPAEYAHYCKECGVEDGNEHGEDCKLQIVEEFLNKYSHAIERLVTA
jgi:hypothetical protein